MSCLKQYQKREVYLLVQAVTSTVPVTICYMFCNQVNLGHTEVLGSYLIN